MVNAERDVRLPEVRRKIQSFLRHRLDFSQFRFVQRFDQPMETHPTDDELRHGQREIWIAPDGLIIPGRRLFESLGS